MAAPLKEAQLIVTYLIDKLMKAFIEQCLTSVRERNSENGNTRFGNRVIMLAPEVKRADEI